MIGKRLDYMMAIQKSSRKGQTLVQSNYFLVECIFTLFLIILIWRGHVKYSCYLSDILTCLHCFHSVWVSGALRGIQIMASMNDYTTMSECGSRAVKYVFVPVIPKHDG